VPRRSLVCGLTGSYFAGDHRAVACVSPSVYGPLARAIGHGHDLLYVLAFSCSIEAPRSTRPSYSLWPYLAHRLSPRENADAPLQQRRAPKTR
jgi:hypothetical protein